MVLSLPLGGELGMVTYCIRCGLHHIRLLSRCCTV